MHRFGGAFLRYAAVTARCDYASYAIIFGKMDITIQIIQRIFAMGLVYSLQICYDIYGGAVS